MPPRHDLFYWWYSGSQRVRVSVLRHDHCPEGRRVEKVHLPVKLHPGLLCSPEQMAPAPERSRSLRAGRHRLQAPGFRQDTAMKSKGLPIVAWERPSLLRISS